MIAYPVPVMVAEISVAAQNEAARRLTSIPGIGTLNATALVAAVGDARRRSREVAISRGKRRLNQMAAQPEL